MIVYVGLIVYRYDSKNIDTTSHGVILFTNRGNITVRWNNGVEETVKSSDLYIFEVRYEERARQVHQKSIYLSSLS